VKKEDVMSSVAYKNLETEEAANNEEKGEGEIQTLKPFAVPSRRVRSDDQVARRIAEVLNLKLTHGLP
jgi:hypothetical protein